METLEAFRKRIQTAQDIHSIVKIMKTIASVNIRQFARAVESLSDYSRAIELGLQAVLRGEVEALWKTTPSTGKVCAIIFGSDQGLCGRFNEQIASFALQKLKELAHDSDRIILTAGLRLNDVLKASGIEPETSFDVPDTITAVTASVQQVLFEIRKLEEKNLGRLFLFYSKFSHGMEYSPVSVKLLPLDKEWLIEIEKKKWPTNKTPFFRMEREDLFSSLARQFFFTSIYEAFAQSLASENAARLSSMQLAERNISARLTELKTAYGEARQTSITEEILDIISGFEVLAGKAV